MGIDLLTEEQYRALQIPEMFGTTSLSWIKTPTETQNPSGALVTEYRYGHVVVSHYSASSCHAISGFRSSFRKQAAELVRKIDTARKV